MPHLTRFKVKPSWDARPLSHEDVDEDVVKDIAVSIRRSTRSTNPSNNKATPHDRHSRLQRRTASKRTRSRQEANRERHSTSVGLSSSDSEPRPAPRGPKAIRRRRSTAIGLSSYDSEPRPAPRRPKAIRRWHSTAIALSSPDSEPCQASRPKVIRPRRSTSIGLSSSDSEPVKASRAKRSRLNKAGFSTSTSHEHQDRGPSLTNEYSERQTRSKSLRTTSPQAFPSNADKATTTTDQERPSRTAVSEDRKPAIKDNPVANNTSTSNVDTKLFGAFLDFIKNNKNLVQDYISQLPYRDATNPSLEPSKDDSVPSLTVQANIVGFQALPSPSSESSESDWQGPAQPVSATTKASNHVRAAARKAGLTGTELLDRYGNGEIDIAGQRARSEVLSGEERCGRCVMQDERCVRVVKDEYFKGDACIGCRRRKHRCCFSG